MLTVSQGHGTASDIARHPRAQHRHSLLSARQFLCSHKPQSKTTPIKKCLAETQILFSGSLPLDPQTFNPTAFFPHRCPSALSSVQGPAAVLHATKALANLVTNLLGLHQSGAARSPGDFGFAGQRLQAEMEQRKPWNSTSRMSCLLQADTCSASAFLQ